MLAAAAGRRPRRAGGIHATQARCLNPRPEMVADERFAAAGFFDTRDLVQVKYEAVRAVREDDVPVMQAAAAFGFSRQS